MSQPLYLAIFLGYLLSFALYFASFELSQGRLAGWDKRIMALTLCAHLVALAPLLAGRGPDLTAPFMNIYALTFLILVFSFFMEWRYHARYLMMFSLPITLIFSLLAVLLSNRPIAQGSAATPWLWAHVGLLIAGFACLLTAAAGALMYLLQSYQIKSKHLGNAFLKLPSLNTLDILHFRALAWGVILFSLGILCGILWAQDLRGLGQVLRDPRATLSFVTCFLYWLVLSFRLSALRRGQKIAAGTLIIFALLIVTWMSSHDLNSLRTGSF